MTHVSEDVHPVAAAYIEHYGLLRYVATRRFGVPPEDVRALVHDVFVSYIRHASTVRNVRSWLVGAIFNICRDYWAVRGRPLPQELNLPGLQDEVATRVDVARVLAAVAPRCRAAMVLRYVEGRSMRELAARLGTTEANARKIVSRCLSRARMIFIGAEPRP